MSTEDEKADALAGVAGYFSAKVIEYGDTPLGVDWNGEQRQLRCFAQLVKIVLKPQGFSLNDLGCGYGALYDYLKARYTNFSYFGYDVSADMIHAARGHCGEAPNASFAVASEPLEVADYGVACGIFSVRLECSDTVWRENIKRTLDALDRTSRLGFAFNSLTSYSDPHQMRDYLYYADPCELFDLCKRRYSRDVALLHDYGLYEFTVLVRKRL